MVYDVKKKSDGNYLDSVTEVSFSRNDKNSSRKAEITVFGDERDDLSLNDVLILENNGSEEFIGQIKKIPSEPKNSIKLVENFDDLFSLNGEGRIFYNKSSDTVITKLINETVDTRGLNISYSGDNMTDVSSNAPEFELSNFSSVRPERYGTDMLYIGFPSSSTDSNEYNVTINNIVTDGDYFQKLYISLIANNYGDLFNFEVQYIESETNYIWDDIGQIDSRSFVELSLENARDKEKDWALTANSSNNNTLRIHISLSGTPPERRAIGIDAVITNNINVTSRDSKINNINIPNSDRNITRQFNGSIGNAVQDVLDEENKILEIDQDYNVNVRKKQNTSASLIIDEDTPIITFEPDVDVDKIINKVVVEGANDIYYTDKNQASIDQFNTTNIKRVRDRSIIRMSEAEEKASQILRNNAFKDVNLTIKMPYTENLRNSQTGEIVTVNRQGINGNFILKEINDNSKTWVEVILKGE